MEEKTTHRCRARVISTFSRRQPPSWLSGPKFMLSRSSARRSCRSRRSAGSRRARRPGSVSRFFTKNGSGSSRSKNSSSESSCAAQPLDLVQDGLLLRDAERARRRGTCPGALRAKPEDPLGDAPGLGGVRLASAAVVGVGGHRSACCRPRSSRVGVAGGEDDAARCRRTRGWRRRSATRAGCGSASAARSRGRTGQAAVEDALHVDDAAPCLGGVDGRPRPRRPWR